MRGKRIFDEIINGDKPKSVTRRGRNDLLMKMRNECLLARYFYYGYYKNMCYEAIVKQLVIEFYLSSHRVIDVILGNEEVLHDIRKRGGALYYFQHKWPHLKW